MITTHFGLLQRPFEKDIPVANLYLTAQHRQVLRRMESAVAHGGHVALSGEVGVGKSTLWRAFCDRLTARHRPLYVGNDQSTRGILRAVAGSFGLSPRWQRGDLIAQVQHAIAELHAQACRRTVLAIDESHLLQLPVLEDLRLLTNFACDSQPLLSLLLMGQLPLRDRMRLKAVEALSQRLDAQLTLEPLGRQETGEYLRHHLSLAGATGAIFSGTAEESIFDRSQGIPRRINQIALQGLELAAERGEMVVDERLVELALNLN